MKKVLLAISIIFGAAVFISPWFSLPCAFLCALFALESVRPAEGTPSRDVNDRLERLENEIKRHDNIMGVRKMTGH